jgi:hypothetical protein
MVPKFNFLNNFNILKLRRFPVSGNSSLSPKMRHASFRRNHNLQNHGESAFSRIWLNFFYKKIEKISTILIFEADARSEASRRKSKFEII